jgi:deazaflavin-dependent oxidoreductase (nitroreductase family)
MQPRKKLTFYRLIKKPPQFLYAIGLGPLIGGVVLLLTTTGRKSGKPRITPLQYERFDGKIYFASAFGKKSDWLRNIMVNPEIEIQVKSERLFGKAEVITEPKRIADYLSYRLEKHPLMMRMMIHSSGLKGSITKDKLEKYAEDLILVSVSPHESA